MRIFVFLTALCMLLGLQSAFAHSLYLFAQYDGKVISGKSYYSDMTPAAATYIEAYRQGENEPAVFGKTDQQGEFHLPIEGKGVFKVVIEGEEGHKTTTYAANLNTNQSSGNELMLVREDIAHLRDKIYFRDIIGGLGYVFGIFGLWAWLQSRRSVKK